MIANARLSVAKVRIAPMEHWCPYMLGKQERFPELDYSRMPGTVVRIYTTSLTQAMFCDGRLWLASPESVAACAEAIGDIPQTQPPKTWYCEHMLEMD